MAVAHFIACVSVPIDLSKHHLGQARRPRAPPSSSPRQNASTTAVSSGCATRWGHTILRAEPVTTDEEVCDGDNEGDTSIRGIFLAHRNVWSAIALSADPSARSLVLESDFSVGNATDDEIKRHLDAAWTRDDEDMTNVGWCDLCSQTEPSKSPCYGCATGYIMHPRFATAMVTTDFCMAADTALIGACSLSTKLDWAADLQRKLGRAMNCSFQDVPSQGDNWFRGVFQQDLEHFAGSHNGMRSDQPEAILGSGSGEAGAFTLATEDDEEAIAQAASGDVAVPTPSPLPSPSADEGNWSQSALLDFLASTHDNTTDDDILI